MSVVRVEVIETNRVWEFHDGKSGIITVHCNMKQELNDVVRLHFRVRFDCIALNGKKKRAPPRYITVAVTSVPYEDATLTDARPMSRVESKRRIKNISYGRGALQSEGGLSEAIWVLAFKDKKNMQQGTTATAPWHLYCDWKLREGITQIPVFELLVREVSRRSTWGYIVNEPCVTQWRRIHIRVPSIANLSDAEESADVEIEQQTEEKKQATRSRRKNGNQRDCRRIEFV